MYEAYRAACVALGKLRPAHINVFTGDYEAAIVAQHNARVIEKEVMESGKMTMSAIEEANKRAQEEMKPGPTPFHDKHFGSTPIGDLTTEQLQEEIDRRGREGPFTDLRVTVRVYGVRPNGDRSSMLHWEYQDVDPLSFSANHNNEFLDFKVARKERHGV
jgi:hypothetical protein